MTMRELMKSALGTERTAGHTTRARTLAGYLATAGDPAKAYKSALDDATRRVRRDAGGHGSLAEALAEGSLTGGGYHQYLSDAARAARRAAEDSANRSYLGAMRDARSAYATFLAGQDAAAAQLRERVKSFVTDAKMTDPDEIRRYGVSQGLSDKDAATVATEAIDAVRKRMRDDVLKTVIREDMARAEAYTYAVAAGLDKQSAREIADLAQRMREAVISDTTLFN